MAATAPPILWTPSPERVERALADALPALAGAAARPHVRLLRGAAALVGRRARRLLALDLGLLRRAGRRLATSACWPARDAGRGVVPGRARSTTPSTSSASSDADAVAIRHAGEGRALARDDVGRAARADRAHRRRPARAGRRRRATASSPTCRTCPRRSRRCSRRASLGRDLVERARPTSARAVVVDRFAQIEPTVLLAVDGYRYNGRDFDRREVVAGCARDADAARRPCCCPTSTRTPTLDGHARVGGLPRARRRRS